ncbi:ribose ABC transporter substrate-binding protein [Mesorhizobium sp. M1A.F.Ca.IN.020.06.1.1]|nr:ribose ABC transporter substrate-binding protein [Mesorhizobium sp. M1A.F.Ca.IN.020.32.1.1]RUW05303.1 ribose ABC transporter substrate-binding protein [Mesorhizobium sp. M1A.F.Ca.IN.022.05.2.1]RUW22914.1 ribose ABC transporter substrate-binding protein [Mesorhizobium sp. M1A.F.Ca.IN.020.06.1.1]RWF83282.1 MAG: ribose ABC transporter substrate-binding protein [Mesorhizobium sp.]RWG06586.1 MAG: ribose ABC transporter substrate-binding protein [Mesorhizobium sp.]
MRNSYLVSAAVMVVATSSAFAEGPMPMNKGADITAMCGDKPAIVALADGYGGDTWRKISLAEFKDEASKCSNITRVLYTDAGGDPQKATSDLNSLVAQGANVIVVAPDFSQSLIPAMRAAMKDGVVVVPYNAKVNGEAGKDFSANVVQNVDSIAAEWAKWLHEHIKEGGLLYFSGPAGTAYSKNFNERIKANIGNYHGLKPLSQDYIVTNWNPADAQKAAAGAIATYPKIDVVAVDVGPVGSSVVRSFQQAGLEVPAVVSMASNNELNCMWADAKAAGKPFPYITLDGTTYQTRIALRRGLSLYEGTKDSDGTEVAAFVYADSLGGKEPFCDKSAPLDADFSGGLTPDALKAIFK